MNKLFLLLSFFVCFTNSPASARLTLGLSNKATISRNVFKVFGSGAPGSGVLVVLPDRKTAILTSKHVVSGMGPSEEIEIQFSNGLLEYVASSDVINLPGMDLAIVPVDRSVLEKSDQLYMASMIQSDSVVRGQEVVVAGFPISGNSISETIRISPGIVQTISVSDGKDGYDVGYSSKTYVGMSGGALISKDGYLVGIHGRGEALSSGDVNKTGTNYAVSVKKIFSYYRDKFEVSLSSSADPVDASRQILFGDYSKAFQSWTSLATKYPESIIAHYNADCLADRLGKRPLSREKYPLIFGVEYAHTMTNIVGDYISGGKGFMGAYMNDPLVNMYWQKPKEVPFDTIWVQSFGAVLYAAANIVNDPTYRLPGIQVKEKDRCVLFSVVKRDDYTSKIQPPVIPVPFVNDTIRP